MASSSTSTSRANRTPYTDSKARGIFSGLSLGHTAAHLYRAIEEGVCYDVAHNLLKLRQAGIETKELVASVGHQSRVSGCRCTQT